MGLHGEIPGKPEASWNCDPLRRLVSLRAAKSPTIPTLHLGFSPGPTWEGETSRILNQDLDLELGVRSRRDRNWISLCGDEDAMGLWAALSQEAVFPWALRLGTLRGGAFVSNHANARPQPRPIRKPFRSLASKFFLQQEKDAFMLSVPAYIYLSTRSIVSK